MTKEHRIVLLLHIFLVSEVKQIHKNVSIVGSSNNLDEKYRSGIVLLSLIVTSDLICNQNIEI